MKFASLMSVCGASLIALGSAAGQGGPPPKDRPALEQQLRERLAAITRQRLQLDDAQMSKLQSVNARYAPQMAAIVGQERQTRQHLRQQLTAVTPDQAQVASLMDDLLRFQKQRITLLEAEQKDLAAFLTPVQRAKYMALQQEIRRRAEQLRGNGRGPGGRARMQPPR